MIGTNTLLYGEVGSGKTSALPTFIKAGLENNLDPHLAVVITDPGGDESLIDGMKIHARKGETSLPLDRLHYKYFPPAATDWSAIIEMAKNVNNMGYSNLAELKQGLAKAKHRQLLDVLSCLANFEDQNGDTFGPVDHLDSNWMLAVDGLSGINEMCRQLHVGLKPSLHQGEWGVIMETELAIVRQLVSSTKCFTCLVAHADKTMDEVIGKPQFMPGFLGNKLAPKVPRIFSDCILAKREDDKFFWSTTERNYSSLKARNLRLADKLQPDFSQIIKSWLARQKMVDGE